MTLVRKYWSPGYFLPLIPSFSSATSTADEVSSASFSAIKASSDGKSSRSTNE